MMSFENGETIGDYRILDLLGEGGMGKVFKVRNLISDRVEAMKVMLPQLNADPGFEDRFLREIKLHATLDHPNIAELRTALRVGKHFAMVMEYVEGTSLQKHLQQGPVSLGEGLACIGQVLSALAYAHGRGVIHRDIKPANILLSVQGAVKLTDFGIARAAGDRRLTLTGMALGSLYYMSPEQVKNENVDARSDLYSVGITLYEIVTGKRPIDGTSEYSIMTAQVSEMPAAPAALVPGLPPFLSTAIMRALEKEPARRFQTAEEFQNALRQSGATAISLTEAAKAVAVDPAALARIEKQLLPVMGPLTRQLVARAARNATGLPGMCETLAGQIPDERERSAFLRWCRSELQAAPAGERPAAGINPEVLKHIEQQLSLYIGPIAKVMTAKAARAARSTDDLCAALAAEIPSERDRSAFLSAVSFRRHRTIPD